jgi:rhodanese-related sulfurtransferase
MKSKLNDPAKASEYFRAKMEFTTGPMELSHMLEQRNRNINIVDVRASDDYAKGHIPGAISLPSDKWMTFQGLQKDKLNILYCYTQQCHLAATAAVEFAAHGYPVMELEGGFEEWKAHDLPMDTAEAPHLAASYT